MQKKTSYNHLHFLTYSFLICFLRRFAEISPPDSRIRLAISDVILTADISRAGRVFASFFAGHSRMRDITSLNESSTWQLLFANNVLDRKD